MTKILLALLTIVTCSNNLKAQSHHNADYKFDGYMLGAAIRQMDGGNILMAHIPHIEARIPLATENIQFKYGGHLLWGLSSFFAEWNYTAGLIIYPIGKYLGIHTDINVGSFFLDNISYTGVAGAHFDIPRDTNRIISVGVEYFYRNSRDLFNYISFPEYGNTGDEVINRDSGGIGVRIGFRY